MRRRALSVLILAATVVALGAWAPVEAGPNGSASNRFTVEKVVEGPVPPGAVFDVEVNCVAFQSGRSELAPTPVTFQFDENGNPIGDNAVMVGFGYECTATETETNGAQVSYRCDVSEPDLVVVGASEGNGPLVVECIDDQTVRFSYPYFICPAAVTDVCVLGEPVTPEIYAEGIITVTNVFEADVIVIDDDDDDDQVADIDVVAATPTFAG